VFYVPTNTVQVIWETVFTGQKTQPTVQSTEGKSRKKNNPENTNKTQICTYAYTNKIVDKYSVQL